MSKAKKLNVEYNFGVATTRKFESDTSAYSSPNYVSKRELSLNTRNNNSPLQIIEDCFTFKMLRYGKEVVCVIALVLTVFATIQQKRPVIREIPQMKRLFHKSSVVQDWPGGDLDMLHNRVSISEISLVYFYAPWCADSEFNKRVYELVAGKFFDKVYFAAINCWQPDGECRRQYTEVREWPILMAYLQGSISVQYTGEWTVVSLSYFIERLLTPLRRITSIEEFSRARIEHSVIIAGFFQNINTSQFGSFFKSSLKWLGDGSFHDVTFAVITGATIGMFNITQETSIGLYLWNKTMYFSENNWSSLNLTHWAKKHIIYSTPLVAINSKKSTVLADYIRSNPSLIILTPRYNFYQTNVELLLVKRVLQEYYMCNDVEMQSNLNEDFIQHKVSQHFRNECQEENLKKESKETHSNIGNITLNKSNVNELFEKGSYVHKYSNKVRREFKNLSNVDQRSPEKLLYDFKVNTCKKLKLLLKPEGIPKLYDYTISPINGLGCKYNNTLSFLVIDERLYPGVLQKSTLKSIKSEKSSAVIIDNAHETVYEMDGSLNQSSLRVFIKKYHDKNLKRTFRKRNVKTNIEDSMANSKVISILDTYIGILNNLTRNANSTIVVLFHSSQCATCNIISHSLLKVAAILKKLNLNYLRIDGDKNDLPWQYSMGIYPTMIIFPRKREAESIIFPHNMEMNEKNILGFILSNLHFSERLQGLTEYCDKIKITGKCLNCITVLRRELSGAIQINLKLWKQQKILRGQILKRLQIMKKAFVMLLKYENICNMEHVKTIFAELSLIWK